MICKCGNTNMNIMGSKKGLTDNELVIYWHCKRCGNALEQKIENIWFDCNSFFNLLDQIYSLAREYPNQFEMPIVKEIIELIKSFRGKQDE